MKSAKLARWMTAHYAVIQVLFNAIYLSVYGFASVYLRAHGLTDSHIGVVLALGTVLNIVAQPLMGSLADRVKLSLNKLIACFFGVVLAVAVVMIAVRQPVILVAGLFVLLSFGVTISETFGNSLAMEQVNRGVALNFGLARGIGSVGYALASLMMGRVIAARGENAIMPIVALLCALCILVLLPFGRRGGREDVRRAEAAKAVNLKDFVRENKRFCLFVVGVALMYYCYCVRANYMYQIVLSIGGDVEQYGTVSAFTAFVELPAMACYPFLSKRFRPRTLVLFAAVCFVVRTLIICFADSMAWIYVSQSMQLVSYALFVPASVYYVNEMVGEANRNKGQTFLGAGQSVSSICASLAGGLMLTAAGGNPRAMLLTASMISAVGVALLFVVTPRKTTCAGDAQTPDGHPRSI